MVASYFSSNLSVLPKEFELLSQKLSNAKVATLQPLLDRLLYIKERGVTTGGVVVGFLCRLV